MAKKRSTSEDKPIQSSTAESRSRDRHKPRRTLSLPPDLYLQLSELAKANNRPLLWEARLAIERHLDAARRRRSPDDAN